MGPAKGSSATAWGPWAASQAHLPGLGGGGNGHRVGEAEEPEVPGESPRLEQWTLPGIPGAELVSYQAWTCNLLCSWAHKM